MTSMLFSNLLKHKLLYTYFENVTKAVLANTQGYTDCMITLQRSINFILEQPELQMLEDRLKVIEVNFSFENLDNLLMTLGSQQVFN